MIGYMYMTIPVTRPGLIRNRPRDHHERLSVIGLIIKHCINKCEYSDNCVRMYF